MTGFETKDAARQSVWDRLQEEGVARFPFPPHGRIPNFDGARKAAERLLDHALLEEVEILKCNPDAPQRWVRALALERGIGVLVPTPRLRGGFQLLDPESIPEDRRREAASLSKMSRWARQVPLPELPEVGLVVSGSVAVTEDGRRCGKGEGYSDLELAILRELGHPAPPVVTTVHEVQVVDRFPVDAHDLSLSLIVTPERSMEVEASREPPEGIDWSLLDEEDLEGMPVLRELRG